MKRIRLVFYNYPELPYGQKIDNSEMHYKMPCIIIWVIHALCLSQAIFDGFYKWFDLSVRVLTLSEAGH